MTSPGETLVSSVANPEIIAHKRLVVVAPFYNRKLLQHYGIVMLR